ncbi:MAG: TonB-dependent receptor [Acidobacteriia bacterium]|nr:TonB-dependent receptor [Terriglobia bacterium]
MRFERFPKVCRLLLALTALLITSAMLFAQETTGGLQGTVKDPSGAVVSKAHVEVVGTTLVGTKSQDTDSSGYYRFSNLPPGEYTITVTAKGFKTVKRAGLNIEVGHLPSVDIALEVGSDSTVVEVTGAAPVIDVTTVTTLSNITHDVVDNVPHGRSFQSVIQFAPSARNEPLEGSTAANGSGGMIPGSATNGSAFGYSVGGASDAENSYLVEGQQTANLIGGFSHTNVPFDFIQEVQVKSTGQEAQYGGALGGVVNVVMRKGSNAWHGSVFSQYETAGMDGSPNGLSRYDPSESLVAPGGTFPDGSTNNANAYFDPAYQNYQPVRRKMFDVMPGFTFGGPILKNRIFGFVGFNPELYGQTRTVDMSGFDPTLGKLPFSRNIQTYYMTARVDAEVSQKIRLFGSWLYQYQRVHGVALPTDDSTTGLLNFSGSTDPSVYGHNLGYKAPNVTLNFGADITITPRLVSTTRLGYYFENYVDAGYPTNGSLFQWQTDGTTSVDNSAQHNPLPSELQQVAGVWNAAHTGSYTRRDANKAIQFDQDVAFFKSGWGGTHNFKFGYQLNRLQNDILQTFNMPYVELFVGDSGFYSPGSQTGVDNCASAVTAGQAYFDENGDCAGLYGTAIVSDFGTGGNVTSFNHGLFAQDAWTIGHGITINAGIRFDKEYLPASSTAGLNARPINYSWTDKIAPRIGAAWDVFRDGRMKVFGSYGKFFDIMKLNVAISSFGGQYWNDCAYTLNTADLSSILPAFNSGGRYCPSNPSNPVDNAVEANWAAGAAPAGMTFIENLNYRTFPTTCATCELTSTGVVPGLKPYQQHESVFGVDYQVRKNVALEVRWDRRRLDHVIEDSSLYAGGETFVIGNPGQGTEATFSSFYNFLYPDTPLVCDPSNGLTCPPDRLPPAQRSYDAVELRLTKGLSQHWFGMFSYTYSKLRGNYTGLTSSDVSDGQLGGRSSPNNSRAFDEPYFSFNSFGGSSSGLLPTDRPNTFKGYAYYELGWLKKFTTDFGIFQYLYSGSPQTSYLDVGAGNGGWAVQAWNRGKWVDVTQDPTTGFLTIGAPHTQRLPWFTQSDFSIQQNYKISETKQLTFSANFMNLLNQRAVTAVNEDITSLAVTNQYIAVNSTNPSAACAFGTQCRIVDGQNFYSAVEAPYDVQTQINNFKNNAGRSAALNSQYGQPQYYQLSRNIRLGVKFTF